MSNRPNPVRQPLRFEVRVAGMYRTGTPFNIAKTRAAKIGTAVIAALEIGRKWASNPDDVLPRTTIRVVDLHDGATVMLLHWSGFDPQELDIAVEALRDSGFTLEEVTSNG